MPGIFCPQGIFFSPRGRSLIVNENSAVTLRKKRHRQDQAARAIINDHYVDPPTIEPLGRMVGVNRNTLYFGFRLLFDCGISKFIQQKPP